MTKPRNIHLSQRAQVYLQNPPLRHYTELDIYQSACGSDDRVVEARTQESYFTLVDADVLKRGQTPRLMPTCEKCIVLLDKALEIGGVSGRPTS